MKIGGMSRRGVGSQSKVTLHIDRLACTFQRSLSATRTTAAMVQQVRQIISGNRGAIAHVSGGAHNILGGHSGMPKVIAEKPGLPTLWVDTAIGIKLAKVQKGEAVQEIEKRRMVKLKELVVKLARDCKLLCPEGDQEWEYWGERLDENVSREFAALSRGIRLLHHQAAHDFQVFIAMEAYVREAGEIRLPADIYFHTDPIQQLRAVSQESAFVSVHGLPPMLLEMNNDSRKGMYKHSEELRCKNNAKNRTYAEQFALEQRSFVDSMADFARSFKRRLATGDIEPWEYFAVQGYDRYFREWYRLANKWADWEGLCNFFVSDYFRELPAVKISSQLHARLVTDDRPIEPGDSMDVKHLSLAMPLANFVLTDRKMSNRLTELGIDKEWNAAVFSESTIDNLFAELEIL
jgi:hypothetical protein